MARRGLMDSRGAADTLISATFKIPLDAVLRAPTRQPG
jgi:hypothetical protein